MLLLSFSGLAALCFLLKMFGPVVALPWSIGFFLLLARQDRYTDVHHGCHHARKSG